MFKVRPASGEPIYAQLTRQLKHAISTGQLIPGERIPSVRAMATDLAVNPNTVARAYRDLEREGLLETKRAGGTFVHSPSKTLLFSERLRRLIPYVDQVIVEGWALGLSGDQVRALFEERLIEHAATSSSIPSEDD